MKDIPKRVYARLCRSAPALFYAFLALEITGYLIHRIWWNVDVPHLDMIMAHVKLALTTMTHWAAALAVSECLLSGPQAAQAQTLKARFKAMSEVRLLLVVIGAAVLGLGLRLIQTKNSTLYTVILGAALIALSCGKDFVAIARMFRRFFTGVIIVAGLGLLLGYTHGGAKVGAYGTGLSLGMTYPNTWARAFFLAALLIWYEWLREKPAWTALLFWGAALPVFFVVKCRTIALLMLLFPLAVGAQAALSKAGGRARRFKRVISLLLIAAPFLCFMLTLLLSWQMELLHGLTYGNILRNMSKRFVQAGIALREYSLPLLGQRVDLSHTISVVLNGEAEDLYILDCGYAAYGITRGMLWLGVMMAWQSLANRRALRRRDYGLLIIGVFMSLLSLMEREGFDPWYNLTLLYPLAMVLPRADRDAKGNASL